MKRIAFFFCLLLLLTASAMARNQRDTLGVGNRISFDENKGQWNGLVRYRAQMRMATLFLEDDCFTLVLQHPDNENLQHPHNAQKSNGRYRQHAYKVRFVGSAATGLQGEEQEEGYSNYFLGNDPTRWASHVQSYATVRYNSLYEGIDLRVYSAENALKYDFMVAPGSDPGQIAMRYEGADNLRLQDGNLIVKTSTLDVVELRPYAYQLTGEKEIPVEAHYVLEGNVVRIALGKYDANRELVIDPYLYFSTYTGSHSDNWGASGCYDSYKNTYTTGLVFGPEYPVNLGSYDGSYNGNADIGIFKFDTSGSQRLFATYLGGEYADMPHSLFVNSFDQLILLGTTGSGNFPTTPNAYSTTFAGGTPIEYEGANVINFPNGSDMFVARLSQDGTQLLASTYIGGTGNDGLNYFRHFNSDYGIIMGGNDSLYFNYGDGARGELITDDLNNVYVGSTTVSRDFPTTQGCPQPVYGGLQEGVVFKLDHNLSHLLWSTYFGGTGNDAIYSIDVDKNYNLLVTGGTNSTNLPTTPHCINPAFTGGSADGFVAKISRYGTQLMACTYYGSSSYDQSYFVRCGKNDDVFIFGQTKCQNSTFVHNATYNVPGAGQFLARLAPNLDSIIWSTTFGSSRHEPDISPTAFTADICNRIYLCGWGRYFIGYRIDGVNIGVNTRGTTGLPVTSDAYQSTTDGQDFYIMCLAADASQMEYATYFGELYMKDSAHMGNDHVDGGTSRFDRLATLYESVCGSCGGYNGFPTTANAWSRTNNSNNCNNAIFRLNVKDDFPVAEFRIPEAGCAPLAVHFENTGRGDSFYWDFGDGTTSTLENPSHTYANPGSYTITLIARLPGGCREADTLQHELMVIGNQAYSLDTLSTCNGLRLQIGLNPSLGCSYRWIQGDVSDSTIANPYVDSSGTYMLIVSSDGCADTLTQVVQLGHVKISIIGDTSTCVSPSTYRMETEGNIASRLWSSHNDFVDTLGRNATFVYHLQNSSWLFAHVTDQLGCTGDDSIFIRFYSICDSLIVTNPACHDSCDGSATVILTSYATLPMQYDWGEGNSSDSILTGLCSGIYSVTLTDANGCAITKDFSLANPKGHTLKDSVTDAICKDDCNGAISLYVDAHDSCTILWQDNGSNDTLRPSLCPGTYIVTIIDSNGCIINDTLVVKTKSLLDSIDAWADDSLLFDGENTTLHATNLNNVSYSWQPTAGLTSPNSCNTTAFLFDTTTYYVTATDQYGCTATDSIIIYCITVDCGESNLFIPNIFTPNGDGKNDRLCFSGENILSFYIAIFTRWGELVYESHSINQCWDGRYKDNWCQPGVYTYTCRITCDGHKKNEFKGDVTIVR